MKNSPYKIERPNFKLVITSQKTVVHKENNRVVTTVEWELVTPEVFNNLRETFGVGSWLGMSGVCKGVAVCNTDDEFDLEKGVKISIAKAESNAYRNAANRADNFIEHLAEVISYLSEMSNTFVGKTAKIMEHNAEYVYRISK